MQTEYMVSSTRSPLAACRSALISRFKKLAPRIALDKNGYVGEASQNLIEGVSLLDFEADLRQGDGNEMAGKFCAVHSSSALAVNSFAPFKSKLSALRLPGGDVFTGLCFERKCPHGIAGRRSPNLDVVAQAASRVVAIESKCLEPLSTHVAEFAPVYIDAMRDRRRQAAWFQEMRRLIDAPRTYRWLDAAQLVKHAFGVGHTFAERPATLLYLFWEPSNPKAHPAFAEHRSEVERFRASVKGSAPEFVAMSYPELWKSWSLGSPPDWLRAHIRRLELRYGVVA
jgi:hypothetical protein